VLFRSITTSFTSPCRRALTLSRFVDTHTRVSKAISGSNEAVVLLERLPEFVNVVTVRV
jgi:hypothetical protein